MKELFKNLKFAWKYVKGQKSKIILLAIIGLFLAVIGVVLPILSARLIVYLTSNELLQLLSIAFVVFAVEILKNIMKYFSDYLLNIVYRETFNNIQISLGKEMLKLKNKTLDSNSSGFFIQRLMGDTSKLSSIFNIINSNLTEIISSIGILIAVLIINFWIFLYMLIVVILLFVLTNMQWKSFYRFDKMFRGEEDNVSGFTGEVVRGARDIKMLHAENSFINVMNSKIKKLNQTRYKMLSIDRNYNLINDSVIDLSNLLLIIIFIYFITNNIITIPMAIVIYNYSLKNVVVVYVINDLLNCIQNFNLSAERIIDILDNNKFEKEKFGNVHLDKVDGNFEFKDVSFSYGNNKVLSNLSFKVNANSTVAFVGKSGAGKSTIFNLIDKMYDVDSGEILIDGVNINELDKDSIRKNITVINQSPYIFNLSVKDNLKLVKEDLTDKEMVEACKMACLDDFINTLPDKYDTIVGEGGITLSGGQKQRLAIARALIQKTEIILFDEATSALDNETQKEIQQAINNMQGEYTILIIAHRLSTIIDSDRILFLNDGHIEAEGTHEELLENCPNYKHLYETELKTNTNE